MQETVTEKGLLVKNRHYTHNAVLSARVFYNSHFRIARHWNPRRLSAAGSK